MSAFKAGDKVRVKRAPHYDLFGTVDRIQDDGGVWVRYDANSCGFYDPEDVILRPSAEHIRKIMIAEARGES